MDRGANRPNSSSLDRRRHRQGREYTHELVELKPELIVANGTPVLAALKQVTTTIPIIFVVVNDPVAQGFVANLTRPGGNITGFSFLDY